MASQAASIFKALCDEYAGSATSSLMTDFEEQVEQLESKENWRATVVIKTLKKRFREATGKQFPFDSRVKDLSKELHGIHEAKFGKRDRPARGGGRVGRVGGRSPMVMMEIPPEMVQAVLQLGGRISRSNKRGQQRGQQRGPRPRMTINRHRKSATEEGSTTPKYGPESDNESVSLSSDEEET